MQKSLLEGIFSLVNFDERRDSNPSRLKGRDRDRAAF